MLFSMLYPKPSSILTSYTLFLKKKVIHFHILLLLLWNNSRISSFWFSWTIFPFFKLHVKIAIGMFFRLLNTSKIEIFILPLKCISPHDFSFTIYFPTIFARQAQNLRIHLCFISPHPVICPRPLNLFFF